MKSHKERLFASTLLAGVASLGVPMAIGTAVITAPTDATAQDYTNAIFSGRVIDTNGAAISGARVVVRSNDQAFERAATTNSSGRFSIPAIPQGEYTVSIEGQGYQGYLDDSVPIRINASSFNFTLAQMGEDEIVVTAARTATLEFNRTATGLVVNTQELASRIPLGRDIADVALLAPSATGGDESFDAPGSNYGRTTSVSGASIGENAFYVNGLNVTNHRTLIGGSRIPFEFYDTVEIRTGGYQAEYGRATGGVINTITKSGSNDFHWGVVTQWSPETFNETTSPNTYQAANEFDTRDSYSAAFYASGAIIPDRLFFYGIYEAQRTEAADQSVFNSEALINALGVDNRRPDMGIRQTIVNDSPFYAFKLDFNITPSGDHRLEYTYFNDENESMVSKDRMTDDGEFIEHRGDFSYGGGGVSQIIRYTGELTDWLTISAAWGRNEQSDFIHAAPNPNLAMVDVTGGFTIETGDPWNATTIQDAEDTRDLFRVDADLRFDLLGSHHIRMGYDREQLETFQDTHRNGPCTNIVAANGIAAPVGGNSPYNGQCLDVFMVRFSNLGYTPIGVMGHPGAFPGGRYRYEYYDNVGGFESEQTAMYLQDSWQPIPNLTLQLGVRSDTYENANLNGDTFIEMADQIAPRLGFSWDPGNDGLSKLYGSFGTYYLPVATNTNIRLGGSEFFARIRYSATGPMPCDPNGTCPPGYDGYPTGMTYRDTQNFGVGIVPTLEQARTEGLEPFQEDEWVLGYERTFGDWTLGVNYTHRELVQVIEDMAIDFAVQAYCLEQSGGTNNCSSSASYTGTHQYVLANPGNPVTVQLTTPILGDGPGVFRTLELSPEDLGYPPAERLYDAVQFTFERPFDGRWGVQGSYTWMDSRGNYEGSVKSDIGQDDAGLTQDFDLPGLITGANGPLPNQRRHTFRLFGTYALTENFLVGGNLFIQSPRKFGCLGVSSEPFAQLYAASAWECVDRDDPTFMSTTVTPRGSQLESDWRKNLDLSFIWNQEIPNSGDLQVRFDIFNVFNNEGVTDLNEVGDIATGNLILGGSAGPFATPSPSYGLPLRYQNPRRYQIGVAVRF